MVSPFVLPIEMRRWVRVSLGITSRGIGAAGAFLFAAFPMLYTKPYQQDEYQQGGPALSARMLW
jgi:hypothetical protein